MKPLKKKTVCCVLLLSLLFSFFSCGEEVVETTVEPIISMTQEVTFEEETVTTQEEVPTQEVPTLPASMNPLTGKECDPSLVGKRPVAAMFNNLREALPQIGLSYCDIIYEVLAEGGILRLEGVIQDYKSVPKIGSVRSARPYYVELSTAYDAIYVHAGRSALAATTLKKLGINNLNGVEGPGGGAFYRDQDRIKNGYATEHTMFTGGERIADIAAQLKYRTELNDKSFTAFKFDPAFKSLGSGQKASYIKIPHSNYSKSEFHYNAEDQLYYHTQYGKPHIDGGNDKQIATENVFVLFANHKTNSDGKTLTIQLTGEGKGYYFTCGEAVPIVWKRESQTGTFSYFLENGTELSVRTGKSYISIADVKIQSKITIS